MLKLFSYTFFLFYLGWIAIQFSMVNAQSDEIEAVVHEIQNDYRYKGAMVEVAVYDVKTKEKIYVLNESTVVAPASTTKLFVTAAALLSHANHHLTTRIYAEGNVKDSVLYGNLWIRGGGDPTLGSEYFNKNEADPSFLDMWCDSLKAKGIKKIEGNIISDASEFGYQAVPDGWAWSDIGNAYGAMVSGLSVYDNIVRFTFRTGTAGSPTTLLKVTPEIPNFQFHNHTYSSNARGDNSLIYGAPFQNERTGEGSLQKNTTIRVRGSLPDPEFQFAYEWKKKLSEKGILFTGEIQTGRFLSEQNKLKQNRYDQLSFLFEVESPSIAEIVNVTNHHSDNMFAEQLVSILGYLKDGDGNYSSGMRVLRKFWSSRIDTDGMLLKDGSGLSRSNGISANHLVQLLNYMYGRSSFPAFYESLPVSGQDGGTLKNFCRNQVAEGKIHAKSGTMTGIKSYAGYAETLSGRTLSFAIILNNFDGTSYQATKKLERFMNVLVTLP